tara:strand:- start:215 stop:391 length:177 start_codon:yes stop_codon:yes gene_type:complete
MASVIGRERERERERGQWNLSEIYQCETDVGMKASSMFHKISLGALLDLVLAEGKKRK